MMLIRAHEIIAATLVGALAGCGGMAASTTPVATSEIRAGLLEGYLPRQALPNSLALLPPPPSRGSAAFALDEDVARKSADLRETSRWKQAILDADLSFPKAADTFSCALGAPITETDTPRLYVLLRRTLTDLGLSTYPAKNQYRRARPFLENMQAICTPDIQKEIEKDGSYPSGHASVGWGWALILTEIAPDRTDAILARGLAYGESRSVCNVHWYSDVMQGRLISAGVVARLHAEPAFRADIDAAKSELAAVRARGSKPKRDCAAEAAALVN
jgi:acid phosphatase (class A)